MNILWIVNIIFPFPANILKMNNITSGGWLLGLYDELKKKEDINLAIATVYHGKKLRKIIDNKTPKMLIIAPIINISLANFLLSKFL